ncbi:hypothetical protein Csa_008789 [Cucumis sativus]|uniref:Uncharacterized protein n=1 Tax=Cucumis sativus TaxID=3659 RepID=A0A0A0KQ88_CUCSA|nr:hypothetical protein Csa_008789 [Cucumis sativus]
MNRRAEERRVRLGLIGPYSPVSWAGPWRLNISTLQSIGYLASIGDSIGGERRASISIFISSVLYNFRRPRAAKQLFPLFRDFIGVLYYRSCCEISSRNWRT